MPATTATLSTPVSVSYTHLDVYKRQSKNRTIPRKSPTHLPLNERSVCFASLPRQPLVPLHQIPPLSKTTINPNRKASKRIPAACFGNGDSVLYIGFTLSIYPHRQQAQRFRVRDYPSSQAYIRRPKFRLFRRCRQASAYSCYRPVSYTHLSFSFSASISCASALVFS